MGGLFALLALLPSAHPPIRPSAHQDPAPILDRASRSYDTVRTLQAAFVQIVDNPMIGGPDTTRGKLFQQRPNFFAMRFTEPNGDRVVADGRRLWLYTPSSTPGQVIRSAIPGSGTTGPNLIGQFVENPRERYTARYVRTDTIGGRAVDVVNLVPRSSDLPYSEATVWIDGQDHLVRRIEILETSGQRRTIMLRNLVVNKTVPAREFTFSVPGGVRVVDQ